MTPAGIEPAGRPGPRLAYACAWWHPREATWSYTASRLRAALDEHADVVDVEAQRSVIGKIALRALYGPRRDVPWQYSKPERALLDRAVRRGVRAAHPDAVLGIGEVDTPTGAPTFLYQDTNVAAVRAVEARTGLRSSNLQPSSDAVRERRAAEQLARAREASGIFAFAEWYADFLVGQGVRRDRIVVAAAGMNSPPAAYRDPERASAGRLLFVGGDFARKAGDQVVEAIRRLRAGGDRAVRLTVVGPHAWPLPGRPPDFVDFLGSLPSGRVGELYASHDAFVMPSHFEAFGIAFAEALVAGLPCVARRAYAMAEIIDDGVTGVLIGSDDPDELASAIDALLSDQQVFARVAARRDALLARYDWRAVAGRMVAHIEAELNR